jgi:hypothetical protein
MPDRTKRVSRYLLDQRETRFAATATVRSRWTSRGRARVPPMPINVCCSPDRRPASTATRASRINCPTCGMCRGGNRAERLRLDRGCQNGPPRGLDKARQNLLREQFGRGFADVPGLAVPFAKKAQMQVIDPHIRQLLHLGGNRVGRRWSPSYPRLWHRRRPSIDPVSI